MSKTPKKRILYSNYDTTELFNDAARYLLNEYGNNNNWNIISDIPESEIWDTVNRMDNDNWASFRCELSEFIQKNDSFLLMGTVGLWTGRHAGGFIFSDIDELSKAWTNCDYIEFYDENGHLYLRCSHHDGTNLYEIKKISKQGMEYYSDKIDNDDENEKGIHQRMFSCNFYTMLPHFAHDVYGYNKLEYEKETTTPVSDAHNKTLLVLERQNGWYGGYEYINNRWDQLFNTNDRGLFCSIKYYTDKGYTVTCLDRSQEEDFMRNRPTLESYLKTIS